MSSTDTSRRRGTRTRPPSAGRGAAHHERWLRLIRGSSGPGAVITAAVLATAVAGCGTRLASGEHGQAARPRPPRAVVTATFRLPGIVFGLASGDGAAWLTT